MNVAIASAATFGVAMVLTLSGHRTLFELDLVAMVVLGVMGMKRSRSPESGESGTTILLISLPAAVIGSLFVFGLVAMRAIALLRY